MVKATVVGFPRLGPFREAKTVIEKFWSGKGPVDDVLSTYQKLREDKVKNLTKLGLDQIPVGDHAFYDHVLDNIFTFGAIPPKYSKLQEQYVSNPSFENYLKLYSAMGRGYQKEGHDLTSMEMKKWFDTNYHFIVPEISPETKFKLTPVAGELKPVTELKDAQKFSDKELVPTLVGPFTFLALAKPGKDAPKDFKPLAKLDELVTAYIELFKLLESAGAKTVQLEEPYLVYDFPDSTYGQAFVHAYEKLLANTKLATKITTYYEAVDDKLDILSKVNFDTLHVDLSRAPEQLENVLKVLKPNQKISLGLIDGRMLWKSDLTAKLDII